ncbi:uncharacterized protein HMPREF1541_05910 [Cyphellophora europaea CBS 101466]|uniref:Tr-type G domain-containing protein n=1 Tax=Cyphellophora europaea (strain CBS 101466) TaxID=1220924 RepID=W2RVE9_CYPE1|nr:uncharacterized protein HMPREF1541_05910 [Cyphellophora europaea CBS 101466]ETN39684.1 hypothetical protein HMPREF1541_05910 [Cyphellophora europaea CBS 101466]
MSSIFTYQDEPPRIQSPWSTPGNTTPQIQGVATSHDTALLRPSDRTRLEPEKQDGPCEYKLHLLLRARRQFASMSTSTEGLPAPNRSPAAASLPNSGRSFSDIALHRSTYQPSPQTRQARLQQPTTQLLWRLQQSSPFHSSSNAELVLPVLPEATPRLGVPERPAKLLPGLEESQGALYEIGVADDGTLVGLAHDELEESLNNLRAMAASLGCVIDILRRVTVGSCEWAPIDDSDDAKLATGDLLVAEVLVRPDSRVMPDIELAPAGVHDEVAPVGGGVPSKAGAEQLRVALAGSSAAGKSSLLGTLTTSSTDNGRGKSRLSLLKHRHEIASGITSSVAHELLGYKRGSMTNGVVVNYASGDVTTWTDIHGLADRLCFISDSPGLSRFAKSTFRALVSWKPDWTMFCAAAHDGDPASTTELQNSNLIAHPGADATDFTLAHLDLCLRLNLRLLVVITKMDVATKVSLRTCLSKILSALKNAGRKPVLLSTASTPLPAFALDSSDALPDLQRIRLDEQTEIDKAIAMIQDESSTVPIVMTSAVTGSGIGKVHTFLSQLPLTSDHPPAPTEVSQAGHVPMFYIDEVFGIPPVRIYNADPSTKLGGSAGVVLCGRIAHGKIQIGDLMWIGPFSADETMIDAALPRSKSFSAHDLRRASHSTNGLFTKPANDAGTLSQPPFLLVKVVSLRNLRLPVLQLRVGETGTIGVEPDGSSQESMSLQRARKGMVLAKSKDSPSGYRSLVAIFPSKDFLVPSPPMLLGGHAIAYLNSIRAAVKVVALALVEDEVAEPSSPGAMFPFDSDQLDNEDLSGREVRITLRFVSTVEFAEVGDQVLVVPTVSAAGPVAGPGLGSTGLAGFVGSITEVVP